MSGSGGEKGGSTSGAGGAKRASGGWLEGGREETLEALAAFLRESGLGSIDIQEGERRVRLSVASGAPAAPGTAAPAFTYTSQAASPAGTASPGDAAASEGAAVPEGAVVSPMVGTVYLAAEPGAPAFVKPGDEVAEGDTLLIIEAMKVMNPLLAPRGGTIRNVLVEDSQPVEFGQPLVVIG